MIRIKKIIPKSEILNVMSMENTHHVELRKKDSDGLRNTDLIKVRIFIGVKSSKTRRNQFNGVIGHMKKYIIEPPQGMDNSILKGMISQETEGWFNITHINKLKKLSREYDLNFHIPKIWTTEIKKYTEL